MRTRVFVAVVAAVALGVVAATASASGQQRQASKITVWLQVDAQSGWPDVVAAANTQFQKDHPGTTVDVQYQNWSDHLQKFDATLAGGNSPDVIEMGNTEMTKYMAAGAFADITSFKSTFDNSANWLKGLAASGVYGGKLYGVPYYAGSRVVTYRTDDFAKAGIKKLPTSLAQFTADAKKLAAKNASVKGFSPVYIAGTDWYFAMSFVYDFGGSIAKTSKGKWIGNLDSPQSIAGLTAYKNFLDGGLEGEQDERREPSRPVRRVLAGRRGLDHRPGLVQLLRRRQVQGRHGAVRDAEPYRGAADARLPRRLRPRGPGDEPEQGARSRLAEGLHQHRLREGTSGEGQYPQRNEPARHERERARGRPELVRPGGQALGRRGERQYPPQHAGDDPAGQADREAGGAERQRQHLTGSEPP